MSDSIKGKQKIGFKLLMFKQKKTFCITTSKTVKSLVLKYRAKTTYTQRILLCVVLIFFVSLATDSETKSNC